MEELRILVKHLKCEYSINGKEPYTNPTPPLTMTLNQFIRPTKFKDYTQGPVISCFNFNGITYINGYVVNNEIKRKYPNILWDMNNTEYFSDDNMCKIAKVLCNLSIDYDKHCYLINAITLTKGLLFISRFN